MSPLARRRQRGVVADATLAAGATLLLLLTTSATARGVALTVVGVLLVLVGLALLWGVPRPDFRTRTLSSVGGMLLGYALVAPDGGATWLPVIAGVLTIGLMLRAVGRETGRRGRR